MEEQKHAEIPSNPSLYESSYLSEKNSLIMQFISKYISVIYFLIQITMKEKAAKNGGHVDPGSTITAIIKTLSMVSKQKKKLSLRLKI